MPFFSLAGLQMPALIENVFFQDNAFIKED